MFLKEAKNSLPKLERPIDTSLYTNLEDFLTPTTLSIIHSAMSEGTDQSYTNFTGFNQDDKIDNTENLSDDETGDDSNESFDTVGRAVPRTSYGDPSGQPQSRSSQKIKSLKRKLPGPRPAFSDDELTEEEMQRRMRRRERNKMAAARCRQRRVDHTNELLHETKNLETEASRLEKEIESLEKLKTKLEIVLQSHIPLCTANVQERQVSTSDGLHGPPSPPLYLTANPQSSLVLVTVPSNNSQSSAVVPTNSSQSLGNLPIRPNTLSVMNSASAIGQSMELRSDGSLFDFNLPPVSSSPLITSGDLHFSSSDFLTPTTLDQHRLFD